jgi:3-deoxy-D-manno-octulosonic acid kinase
LVIPSGFEWVRDDSTTLLVRSDLRAWIVPLLRAAGADWAGYTTRRLVAGRGGTTLVQGGGHAAVVRQYRRGGLPARLWHDTYFGVHARPFRELRVTEALRQRGAPVVEVYGASVRWIAPACYRGWLATRYVAGARSFWEWASSAVSAEERAKVLRRVGVAARRLHDSGGRHPDLNLNNILLRAPADASAEPEVLFIDFDRARATAAFCRPPRADLARLRRSARKLDPQGRQVTAADLECLEAAYWGGA